MERSWEGVGDGTPVGIRHRTPNPQPSTLGGMDGEIPTTEWGQPLFRRPLCHNLGEFVPALLREVPL